MTIQENMVLLFQDCIVKKNDGIHAGAVHLTNDPNTNIDG